MFSLLKVLRELERYSTKSTLSNTFTIVLQTHLLMSIMEAEIKKGTKCVRTDCSNDELVERAMESVLSQNFQLEVKSLLVADEYHMLSEEHKEELFYWISNRLNWLKVVIIANRSNGAWQ